MFAGDREAKGRGGVESSSKARSIAGGAAVTPPFPLTNVLEKSVDREGTDRMWLGIVERRANRRKARARWSLALAFGAGLSAAVLLLVFTGNRPWERTAGGGAVQGALSLRDRGDWSSVDAPSDGTRTFHLSDGSRIELEPAARLAPLENTGQSLALFLRTGRALFEVQPGGPRRWSIEAGLATIEVVGTRFIVTRAPDRLTVEVEHGAVLVRGERVVDRVQRLSAGERLTIDREPLNDAAHASRQTDDAPAAAPPPGRERIAAQETPPSWRDLARQGAYAEAYENLGPDGIAGRAKTADLEQLLALADVARLSGHPRDAVEPLERAVAEHSNHPGAALAAFTLGRIRIDSLGDAAAADRNFEKAITLGLPQALIEDAYLRLIEARAKAGDRRGAHEAWLTHRKQFPQSTRRTIADHWGREP